MCIEIFKNWLNDIFASLMKDQVAVTNTMFTFEYLEYARR